MRTHEQGKRILVTGGAGYIGSVCVTQLLNAGWQVTVFDNLSEGHRAAVDRRANLVVGDLLDLASLRETLDTVRPAAVIHFAASALVEESMRMPEKYFQNNVVAGVNLLNAMIATGVNRLVYSSSCATYGLPDIAAIDESVHQSPVNPYGESKLMFEQMTPWYERAHGLISVGLRFFNVAGASGEYGEDHRVETHLIPNVLKVALGQRSHVDVFGRDYATLDGTCVRDFIHVLDVASAHLAALNADKGDYFNLSNGVGHSVEEVIACCRRITGHAIPVVNGPRRPGDPARLVGDFRKIQDSLGWSPRHSSLEETIESAWVWHRAHPHGYRDC